MRYHALNVYLIVNGGNGMATAGPMNGPDAPIVCVKDPDGKMAAGSMRRLRIVIGSGPNCRLEETKGYYGRHARKGK